MCCMTYILEKPIVRAAAATLAVFVLADAADGTNDFSFKGAPNVIEAVASATSSGIGSNAPWVVNTMSGPAYRAITPENDRTNEPLFVSKST